MPADTIQLLVNLGTAGLLAYFWKTVSDQLIKVIQENTASNTKLITLIEVMNSNVMRKADIELMIEQRAGRRES